MHRHPPPIIEQLLLLLLMLSLQLGLQLMMKGSLCVRLLLQLMALRIRSQRGITRHPVRGLLLRLLN